MGRRVPRRRHEGARHGTIGRLSKLTDRTKDAIVHAVLEGNHLNTACAAAGIGERTLYNWLDRANIVEEAIEAGEHVDPSALAYLQFRQELADARAQAEMRAVQVVHRQMAGGYLISEKAQQDANGDPIRDNDGEILMERTWSQPDGRLALSYLARSRPQSWGQNASQRVELTGAGGGPVQHQGVEPDQVSALGARLAEVIAARELMAAEDAADAADDDTVDAVLVDDDETGD